MGQIASENIKTQASRIPDAPMIHSLEYSEICAALSASAVCYEREDDAQSVVYLTTAVEGLLTLLKREGHLEERP